MDELEQHERRGFHIEKSISIGHILTTIGLVVAAFTWTSQVDKKLAIHDTQISVLQEADHRLAQDSATSRAEISQQLRQINEKLDRYIERGRK